MRAATEPMALRSVFQSHGKLDRSRLVALGVDGAECRRAPVLVGIAEQHPVEQITEIRLEAQLHRIAQTEFLEDVHVLAVVREAAHRAVELWCVAEAERTGI